MFVSTLEIHDLRNLTEIHMECDPGINLIYGKNAAGKTAILEAIHLLARVNSFRTPRINEIIQYGKQQLTVTAKLKDRHSNNIVTGLEKSRQSTRIRFNGSSVNKRSEQARNIPLLTVSPESHRLLNGAPRERRHWLDWSMFHVEPEYMEYWQNYHHALRHRNALLRRDVKQEQFDVWEGILAETAVALRRFRKSYVDRLVAKIREVANAQGAEMNIDLVTAELGAETVKENLIQQRPSDIMLGYTQYGPHREDIVFTVKGRDAGKTLSRGEGKRFILFLVMAQALEYTSFTGQQPVMLIDDLSAELDSEARKQILGELTKQDLQAFITTTDPGSLETAAGLYKRFHVEQGKIAG
jgi:DNA replication and repair protein RecF